MKILGIETSCDETAICLIETDASGGSFKILGNTVHSQIDIHAPYGGVFPTLAKREHQRNLIPVLVKTLKEAGAFENEKIRFDDETIEKLLEKERELLEPFKEFISKTKKPDIDYISVTVGPGLEPALWVGINFARALSQAWNVPIIPSNHMEGHVLTAMIKKNGDSYDLLCEKVAYPALSLLISGGHTQIVLLEKAGSYKVVGETRDDAVGECFDKIARILGLPYPGGPEISKLAEEARKENIASPEPLPRPMMKSDDLDFSFSGLKTSVLYLVKRMRESGKELREADIKGIARESEDAMTEVIVWKMRKAIERYAVETLVIGGGVIANTNIRKALEKLAEECSIKVLLPQFDHAMDNGLMIAIAGFIHHEKHVSSDTPLKAQGTLRIGEIFV